MNGSPVFGRIGGEVFQRGPITAVLAQSRGADCPRVHTRCLQAHACRGGHCAEIKDIDPARRTCCGMLLGWECGIVSYQNNDRLCYNRATSQCVRLSMMCRDQLSPRPGTFVIANV